MTVGLLVDTSMSERDNMDRVRSASRSFLDQMITRPADRAFVIHFDREVELLQDLTSDHAKLEKAVGLIDTQQQVENTQTSDQGSGSHRRAGRGHPALRCDFPRLRRNSQKTDRPQGNRGLDRWRGSGQPGDVEQRH